MRILALGDVSGKSGREGVAAQLPQLREDLQLDFVVVNGENATHNRGINEAHCNQLFEAGADVITLGDHAFDQPEAQSFLPRMDNIVRPLNWAQNVPGRGSILARAANGANVLVINAMGRVFMRPSDDPFLAVEQVIANCPLGEVADAIIVDFHAEATSEMQAMGIFLDGKASLVFGTHTHIPTADHRILREGTGYISDVGMCGTYDSVIGVEIDEPMNRFLTGISSGPFKPAAGEATLSGIVVETDERTGLCASISPLRVGGELEPVIPNWD